MRPEIGRKYKDGIENGKDVVYVVGLSGKTIIYIAKLSHVLDVKEYFTDTKYAGRSDRIYDVMDQPVRTVGKKSFYLKRNKVSHLFHPTADIDNHIRDEAGLYVLLSEQFAYFGAESKDHLFAGFEDIIPPRQGHRSFSTGEESFERAKEFIARYWPGENTYTCSAPRDKLASGCKICYAKEDLK